MLPHSLFSTVRYLHNRCWMILHYHVNYARSVSAQYTQKCPPRDFSSLILVVYSYHSSHSLSLSRSHPYLEFPILTNTDKKFRSPLLAPAPSGFAFTRRCERGSRAFARKYAPGPACACVRTCGRVLLHGQKGRRRLLSIIARSARNQTRSAMHIE